MVLEDCPANARRKHQAPEIQTMYTLNIPVSTIRNKMRQEFERHRYVSKLRTADVLIYNSHSEFQVRTARDNRHKPMAASKTDTQGVTQETLNFWKQLTHVLKYFRAEEDPKARLPKTFIAGFLEVSMNSALSDEILGSCAQIAPYAMLTDFPPFRAVTKSRRYVHSKLCSGVPMGNFLNFSK